MNKTPMTLMMTTLGVALLAGCSAGEAATVDASAPAASSDAVLGSVGGDGGQGREPSGVTGEIAYVADGVAQVQDGSTQTAVSFGDDTAFTAQVELALADIAVGACVTATLGDDDAATAISVTEADEDGSCSVGFGGGGMPDGDRPDGDMPTDMPTAMPDGGDVPADAPTAMPELGDGADGSGGMPQGGFDMSDRVVGTVTAIDGDVLTVETFSGEESTVTAAADVTVTGTEDADADAVEAGLCMTATGEADSSGGYAATSVYVFDGGDEGCVSEMSFGGGRGGMPGGEMPGGDQTGTSEPALESAS